MWVSALSWLHGNIFTMCSSVASCEKQALSYHVQYGGFWAVVSVDVMTLTNNISNSCPLVSDELINDASYCYS